MGVWIIGIYFIARMVAKRGMEDECIDDSNPYLFPVTSEERRLGVYEKKVKPALDHILSFCGLVVLSPLLIIIALAIVLDDPGPVFFIQKRIGRNKRYINIHKFRSMRADTPHDVPTHQLANPEKYITKIGSVLRKTSLDELPQIWDIFRGRMSIIGPRPALWNQDDLVKERDKYGANNVMPGLTGLAQISGRDELEITEKAALDGQYVEYLRCGGMTAFLQDIKCFWDTIGSVCTHNGVVEGGTGCDCKGREICGGELCKARN